MFVLVTGGSGSGKSVFAEQLVCSSNKSCRYYLATMQIYGEEGRQKVERHRRMRAGKGFITLEAPRDARRALAEVKDPSDSVILLECMSNLAANEMFLESEIVPQDVVAEKILGDVKNLLASGCDLVVVTNNVFEDGIDYDSTTKAYMGALGEINQKLAAEADQAVEVVYGIPLWLKGGNL